MVMDLYESKDEEAKEKPEDGQEDLLAPLREEPVEHQEEEYEDDGVARSAFGDVPMRSEKWMVPLESIRSRINAENFAIERFLTTQEKEQDVDYLLIELTHEEAARVLARQLHRAVALLEKAKGNNEVIREDLDVLQKVLKDSPLRSSNTNISRKKKAKRNEEEDEE